MSNSIHNVKSSVNNSLSATTQAVAVTTELAADITGFAANSIGATPAVLKALLQSPFSAAKGYLMEAEGLSEAEAEAVAFHYVRQPVDETVKQLSEASGRGLAMAFADEDNADK